MENIQKEDFSKITLTAIQAALKAGEVLKEGFLNTKFKVSKKEGTHNLVTEYDYKSETIIIDIIKKNYPDHKILSEEKGSIDSSSNYQWIIDPLDGTVNFAHLIPMFCVSIGILKNNQIVSGVIYQPITNELFFAQKNKGSFLNGNPLKVTGTKNLNEAILATGFPYNLKENPDKTIERFSNILKLGVPIRRIGSAALDIAYVAAGRFDLFWETNLKAWDIAAGALILQQANGIITDFTGSPFEIKKENAIIASNNLIHDQFVKQLNKL
ncbi:MAG: inositol monophosphatase [Parachlamydiales bacterium]|nr:inositol monophosphatase [Parachlamydiales bacterium]